MKNKKVTNIYSRPRKKMHLKMSSDELSIEANSVDPEQYDMDSPCLP